MRQIVLDTETTGLDVKDGHRIVEIGAIELLNRRITDNTFHEYINPEREIAEDVLQIHGITNEQLADSPIFRDIAESFLEYVGDAELLIHNAAFDVGFLNHELNRIEHYAEYDLWEQCRIVDTLDIARKQHPGQRNDLDSLCRRYGVNNASRTLHGALLDADLLASVYLQMTGGQETLFGEEGLERDVVQGGFELSDLIKNADALKRAELGDEDLRLHEQWLGLLREHQQGRGPIVWDTVSQHSSPNGH